MLYAPEGYERAKNCSCGSGRWIINPVPDTVWGLSIKEACCIHDYMYLVGVDQKDKEKADRVFLENMLKIIATNTKYGWLKWLRNRRAYLYFVAVHRFGGPNYWDGKNEKSLPLSA